MSVRGQPDPVRRLVGRSTVPMVLVDGERRYVEVNRAARLAFRLPLAELREMKIDQLTPPSLFPTLNVAWERLIQTGCVAGNFEVASLDGGQLAVVYYAAANAVPGLHLIVFAPLGWPDGELADAETCARVAPAPLTARELEVLQLAAEGRTGPAIADELVVSRGTVRTHFENIYEKLAVSDRAGAVARAMRLGLIE